MKNKIILLLKVHNDLCATLHQMNEACEQHKRLTTEHNTYYDIFAKAGEYEDDVAQAEQLVEHYAHQYNLQYSVLKQLTEETHAIS